MIPLDDFPGTEEGEYIVRAHTNGDVSLPMSRSQKDTLIVLELPQQGWEILTAYPVQKFDLHEKKTISFANLGLIGKMTGAAAVVNSSAYVEENGRFRLWTSLKALGTLGVYVSNLDNHTIGDHMMATISGKPVPLHCVKKSKTANVLEIDLARAWEETGSSAGWSNEVTMELFVS
ncbi:hypothetical protein LTS18_012180 [Coniosporium uncinatum]|uniref:Uncharacterized protein n=1 Tax=Coniosporium uncinatum TaxID=93489 RepID=A0ACC3DJ73_9PEZI|nr:hypothetical protein LTS18_012180 [Coniosporium uncinatum]